MLLVLAPMLNIASQEQSGQKPVLLESTAQEVSPLLPQLVQLASIKNRVDLV